MKKDNSQLATRTMQPMSLPSSFAGLFNSYVFESIDEERHASLIVKTVLSRGTWDQIVWLFGHYGPERIGEVFREDYFGLQTLPEPTRRLWELLFVEETQREKTTGACEWHPRRLATRREAR